MSQSSRGIVMSKCKPTFTDPQTGEEIESTALAWWGARIAVWIVGLGLGLVCGLGLGLVYGLVWGLVCGAGYGLIVVLLVCGLGLKQEVMDPLIQRVHDGIARQQHRCRWPPLRRPGVPWAPDGALSRARPPGEPQPTPASLSLVEPPEGSPRPAADEEVGGKAEEPEAKDTT